MSMVRLFIIALALLAGGCPPQKPGKTGADRRVQSGRESEAVLEVGAEELSVAEVQKRLSTIRGVLPGAKADEAQLSTVADFELLADEAERKGYGDDPRVVNDVKDALAGEAEGTFDSSGAGVELDEAKVKAALEAGRQSEPKAP